MVALEKVMCKEWIRAQLAEANPDMQDEGEYFFDSMDPSSWQIWID